MTDPALHTDLAFGTGPAFLTGNARLAGVMGWPVGHSRSPRLHGYWLRHHGIDGVYLPLAVRPEDLKTALRALPKLGFRGVNLTLPHKEAALAIVDERSEMAERIGAVNTVIVHSDGRLFGDNTDGFGFIANLEAGAPDWRFDAGPALILGAGGAARAVAVALLDRGVSELRIANRTSARATALCSDLGARAVAVPWSERCDALQDTALLVNTTSLGMDGQPSLAIDLAALPLTALVTDIVYTPLQTDLLAAARARGLTTVDGLGMLLHQGRPGFFAWFGTDPKVSAPLRDVVLG